MFIMTGMREEFLYIELEDGLLPRLGKTKKDRNNRLIFCQMIRSLKRRSSKQRRSKAVCMRRPI